MMHYSLSGKRSDGLMVVESPIFSMKFMFSSGLILLSSFYCLVVVFSVPGQFFFLFSYVGLIFLVQRMKFMS